MILLPCAGLSQESALLELLEWARVEAGAPGAILGVKAPDGAPIVVTSGYLGLGQEERLEPGQPFFLGSISKTYTATVALRLVEEGSLSLDDTLERWLPSFPRGSQITIRHLLGHTSGLKDFYSYIYFRPDRAEMVELVTRSWTEAELLELSARFGHWFDPGSDWSYSSSNYYLLGVVIERASGLTLAQAYRRYIYGPLGIHLTWLTWHEDARGPLSVGHLGPVAEWKHSDMFGDLGATTRLDRSPVEWGAGGLAAPAADALYFLDGLMNGRLLAESSLQMMTEFVDTPPLGVAGSGAVESGNGYGLGLVTMVRNGVTLVGHGGLFTGHTAGLWFIPECDVTIALYLNRGFAGQRDLLDRVLALLVEGGGVFGACQLGRGAI